MVRFFTLRLFAWKFILPLSLLLFSLGAGILGFWFFQSSLLLRILATIVSLISLGFLILFRDMTLMAVAALFFDLFSGENLFFAGILSFGGEIALLSVLGIGMFFLIQILSTHFEPMFIPAWKKRFLYTAVWGMLYIEMQSILSFWSIDPFAKSFLPAIALFLFWQVFRLESLERLTFVTLRPYLLLSVFLFILVIATTKWYAGV